MHAVKWHVEEERIRGVIAHELRGLAREQFGGILAVFKNLGAVPPQVVIIDGARLAPVIAMRIVVDTTGMEPHEAVETVGVRDRAGRGSQMPLAENPGRVTRRLQQRCDGLFRGSERRPVIRNPRADGIAPGEQRRPRRRADRGRRIPVGEARSGSSQRVDMRRLQIHRAPGPDIVAAQIVGQEDDEIRFAGGAAGLRHSARGRRPGRQKISAREHGDHVIATSLCL